MPVKRRNHGRSRKNCGSSGKLVTCDSCGCRPSKDKAIKRFRVNNMVESSALRDMRDASMYDEYTLPKIYRKYSYCVGCAVHSRVVRSRSKKTGARKDRTPPVRARVLERKFGKDNDNRDGNKPSGQASQGQGAAAAPKPVGA
uniref:40S ribosomal protein S26 n=1 Tax=Prasinoderma singulare TaxID=676789 RepID=A0A7S3FFF4_9VIRI|mmetsp:Transcript_21182/g.65686  ORF Transcript_21182/g.65686 Transcript_21182/m.65686 type:complete len:143 (+) Transcript_21182:144-572(+)|eukprot:CAMPEP_0119160562 /NCGR_PEP_ID=MMETSP1315-20130426/453_1 /TAXON_ID=676789 /ORGANISM="Prasinoderma singularis, Strain RCC927" /LENGTH=142 /DNA_ID=CAMNT_0007153217 /DNA_START=296 /DNA_END=724 /DNA_ORIENTATION=-